MFKVVKINPLGEVSRGEASISSPSLKQMETNMSKLNLNESSMTNNPEDDLDMMEVSITNFVIYKVTSKTQIIFQSTKDRSPDGGNRPPHETFGLAEVGGFRVQKELLRELVLHPLKSLLHSKGQ